MVAVDSEFKPNQEPVSSPVTEVGSDIAGRLDTPSPSPAVDHSNQTSVLSGNDVTVHILTDKAPTTLLGSTVRDGSPPTIFNITPRPEDPGSVPTFPSGETTSLTADQPAGEKLTDVTDAAGVVLFTASGHDPSHDDTIHPDVQRNEERQVVTNVFDQAPEAEAGSTGMGGKSGNGDAGRAAGFGDDSGEQSDNDDQGKGTGKIHREDHQGAEFTVSSESGRGKPTKYTIELPPSTPAGSEEQKAAFDEISIIRDGNRVLTQDWEQLSGKEVVSAIMEISDIIEQGSHVRSYQTGRVDKQVAEERQEEVLVSQITDLFDIMRAYTFHEQLDEDDITRLVNYAYNAIDNEHVKPFAHAVSEFVFKDIHIHQRDVLYSVLSDNTKSLPDANTSVDSLRPKGFFLLDSIPTTAAIAEHFQQITGEAEKSLVVDTAGRTFIVRGIDAESAGVNYSRFHDISREIHTHTGAEPFSADDINVYKKSGTVRDSLRFRYQDRETMRSGDVDFFVADSYGLFQFRGDTSVSQTQLDRGHGIIRTPCVVVNDSTGDRTSFPYYSNGPRNPCGKHIQTLVKRGTGSLTIEFVDGDRIKYQSWNEMKRNGTDETPISEIDLF